MNLTAPGQQVFQVLDSFRKRLNLEPFDQIGVAYSGGCDSAVLLWAASLVWSAPQVTAIWVDHGVRSLEERQKEASLVQNFCLQRGVALIQKGPPEHPLSGEGQEDSFRRYRLNALEEAAKSRGLAVVLTPHHLQDLAETILFRMLQGGSWGGLSGIPERRGLFARPFLHVSQELLQAVALEEHLVWHEDSTNRSSLYQRNFLRNEVFPLIRQRFPQASRALGDFSRYWQRSHPLHHWLDSAWSLTDQAVLPRRIWEQWTPEQREQQLLEVSRRLSAEAFSRQRLSRRFLAQICRSSVLHHSGAGWKFSSDATMVTWSRIVQDTDLAYLMEIETPRVLTFPHYEVAFSGEPWSQRENFATIELPLEDNLIWRSLSPDESWRLPDGRSNKTWRRRHPGEVGLFQKGVLWAVFDLKAQKMRWKGSCTDLIKKVIFVKLSRRSMG